MYLWRFGIDDIVPADGRGRRLIWLSNGADPGFSRGEEANRPRSGLVGGVSCFSCASRKPRVGSRTNESGENPLS